MGASLVESIASPGWGSDFARSAIHHRLNRISTGRLELVEGGGETVWGKSSASDLVARIEVRQPRFYRRLITAGGLGAAESYLCGEWTTDDLVAVFRVLVRNESALQAVDQGLGLLLKPIQLARHWLTRNTRLGSRKNIHAHYDLGNDFFALFLDSTMTYSSGFFASPTSTLEEASVEKYDRICRRLRLTPEHHVVEIGTGWGGFAIHAASHYGCRVTTTTISNEQYDLASHRIQEAQLDDLVEVRKQDYRDLTGEYDRLVSIEMIEAVGHRFLPTYFRKCESLLRHRGEMVLQAITIPDQRYESYRRSVDFIQQYIFPGGCLPSLGRMSESVATTEALQLIHLEDFGHHYAETLARWRRRFWDRIDQVRNLGLDDRFIRMWDYYLAYCEAGFRERMTGVSQLHYSRG